MDTDEKVIEELKSHSWTQAGAERTLRDIKQGLREIKEGKVTPLGEKEEK